MENSTLQSNISSIQKAAHQLEKKLGIQIPFDSQQPRPTEFSIKSPFSQYFDHTYLKSNGQESHIKTLCNEAIQSNCACVCVNPCWIPFIKKSYPTLKTCAVVGFPLGAMTTKSKVFEVEQLVEQGVDEIDFVVNVGWVKDDHLDRVYQEFKAIKTAAGKKVVKVICETCLLSDQELIMVCLLALGSGLDFVKTSTGFSTAGATVHHIKIMRTVVGSALGVKASGGVRTRKFALELIQAGASRIGASCSVSIINDIK